MKTRLVNWLEKELPDPKDQREYAKQRAFVAVSEALGEELEHAGLTRAQLAEVLGVSKGRVSRALGGQNLTLASIAEILWACQRELEDLQTAQLGVSEVMDAASWDEQFKELAATREVTSPSQSRKLAVPLTISNLSLYTA